MEEQTKMMEGGLIWERMITEERRVLASSLGLRVSDIEEQQLLLEAVHESRTSSDGIIRSSDTTTDNSGINQSQLPRKDNAVTGVVHSPSCGSDKKEEDELVEPTMLIDVLLVRKPRAAKHSMTEKGGNWHLLPQVIVDDILCFLGDPDSLGYLCIASCSTFQPSEKVYRYFCDQIYPRQVAKKGLYRLDRWVTWRNMLVNRPRLRTNGFYTLRTKFSKPYCNDAFWEEKRNEFIEVRYYRHLRFFDYGRCLYSLDIAEPSDMMRLLESGNPVNKRVYTGTYTLSQLNHVRVEVKLHYCDMVFDMLLLDGDDGYQGKHNMLKLVNHSSIVEGSHRLNHSINYPIPVFANFRFHRCWHFNG